MTKENVKTTAAVMAALAWFCLMVAGLRYLLGNAILWLLLAGVLSLVALVVVSQIKRRQSFRTKGYEVIVDGEYSFIYRERFGGGVRELRLPGQLIEVGHPAYYRLSSNDWVEMVPEWARDRQLQIEARIHEESFYRP